MAQLDLLPHDEYVAQLPHKRMSAGMLLRDEMGQVLLVEPSYKAQWEIPGGVVEDGESPWVTAVREVREEVGLTRAPGRLLVVDYVPPENDSLPERLGFVFDGGLIHRDDLAGLVLGAEVLSAELCSLDGVREKAKSLLADRIAAAIDAAATNETALCENGKRVG